MKKLLGVPDRYVLAGLLALGHPVRRLGRLRRAPVEAFTSIDRFDGRPFTGQDGS